MKIGLIWNVNVGKSTLFNRLLWKYRAIVTDIPWTTREKISDISELEKDFITVLLDSPWVENFDKEMVFIKEIVEESDILIFVIDSKKWITTTDEKIKEMIIKKWKKDFTILAINKFEGKLYNKNIDYRLNDFYELWFSKVIPISAKQNEWISQLKRLLIKEGKKRSLERNEIIKTDITDVSIIWRPNVGKSTLLNTIAWDDFALVDDSPWTTLDYIIHEIKYKNKEYRFYDTAWIRKRWKIKWIEKIAYNKTLDMLKYIRPISVFLLDAEELVTHRDKTLLQEIQSLRIPLLIAVNKIDKFDKKKFKHFFTRIVDSFVSAKWIPIIPISAQEWIWLPKVFLWIDYLKKEYTKTIETSKLNNMLNEAWLKNPPRFPKNKICKFYYISQISSAPPKFLIFINKKEYANFAFRKWVENNIRKNFGFLGVPISLEFRER